MIVVDASIANKLILPLEEGHEAVRELFKRHIKGEEKIVVPNLLFIEVANTLATKTTIPESKISLSLNYLYSLKLEVYDFKSKDVIKAAELSKKLKTSVYDMLYAVLAEEKGCDLITADEKFVRQVNLSYVNLLNSIL